MDITVVRGDITTQDVDAVVTAANRGLRGGGGVDEAVHVAAGPRLLQACRSLARWVIHPIDPRVGNADAERLLGSAYVSALHRADEVGARSVAFPSISTGVYGCPREAAATISVRALRGATTTVERVLLVAFDDRAAELWRAAFA